MGKINYKKGFGPLAILIAIVVIIVLGGGIYYASHNGSTAGEVTVNTSADTSVKANVSSNGSIRELLALGKNLMCTLDESTASTTVTGTMYISGNMMSGEFTTGTKGQGSLGMVSHMIRNGDTVYAWSGAQGAQMTFSNMMSTSAENKSNVNLDQKVNYKCSDWSVDNSKFAVPTNVKFTDISAMMKASGSAGASVSAQCSACNALSGSAKSQCLSAMHC